MRNNDLSKNNDVFDVLTRDKLMTCDGQKFGTFSRDSFDPATALFSGNVDRNVDRNVDGIFDGR
jgi:hypothetical protein